MCIQGLILCILYAISINLFYKIFHRKEESKKALYCSAATVDIEREANTMGGNLIEHNKDKNKEDDIDMDDIGKGYMN